MSLVPPSAQGKIEFFQSHNTPWSTNAVAIGTTTSAVTALATKVSTAVTKMAAAVAAREVSKNATADARAAVRDMATAGADIIKSIRAKGATDPNVYILASIPAPATPTPVPAPGTPSNFTVAIREDGALILDWKCANPPGSVGVIYQVSRKIAGGGGASGDFVILGSTGPRKFIDETLPVGSSSVTYRIIAERSTVRGNPGQFTVTFGVGGAGQSMVASVTTGGAPRMAA